jgi:hypothetical protein
MKPDTPAQTPAAAAPRRGLWLFRSRTIRLAAVTPALVAALATAEALLPGLRETLGPWPYVALSIAVSAVLAHVRATTTGPLSEHAPAPAAGSNKTNEGA